MFFNFFGQIRKRIFISNPKLDKKIRIITVDSNESEHYEIQTVIELDKVTPAQLSIIDQYQIEDWTLNELNFIDIFIKEGIWFKIEQILKMIDSKK